MEWIEYLDPVIEKRSSEVMDQFTNKSTEYIELLESIKNITDPVLAFEIENTYLTSIRKAIKKGYQAAIVEMYLPK